MGTMQRYERRDGSTCEIHYGTASCDLEMAKIKGNGSLKQTRWEFAFEEQKLPIPKTPGRIWCRFKL